MSDKEKVSDEEKLKKGCGVVFAIVVIVVILVAIVIIWAVWTSSWDTVTFP